MAAILQAVLPTSENLLRFQKSDCRRCHNWFHPTLLIVDSVQIQEQPPF